MSEAFVASQRTWFELAVPTLKVEAEPVTAIAVVVAPVDVKEIFPLSEPEADADIRI